MLQDASISTLFVKIFVGWRVRHYLPPHKDIVEPYAMESFIGAPHAFPSANLALGNGFSTSVKRSFAEDENAAIAQKRRVLDENSSRFEKVCPQCFQILPQIISYSIRDNSRGSKVADLAWSDVNCGICRLLKSIRSDHKNSESFRLVAFLAQDLFLNPFRGQAHAYLKT